MMFIVSPPTGVKGVVPVVDVVVCVVVEDVGGGGTLEDRLDGRRAGDLVVFRVLRPQTRGGGGVAGVHQEGEEEKLDEEPQGGDPAPGEGRLHGR